MELGVEVGQYLGLFACAVERVAGGGVEQRLVVERCCGCGGLHLGGSVKECADVVAGHCDREQTYGGEHREASAHVVGDDKCLVALFGGELAQGAALGVSDGYGQFGGFLLAGLLLELLFEQTEGYCRLCGGARLGDHHYAESLAVEELQQLMHVVLSDVLSGKHHFRSAVVAAVGCKRVAQGLDDCLGAEV